MNENCPRKECIDLWSKDICLATKGNKIFIRVMWSLVVFLAAAAFGSSIFNMNVSANQNGVDTRQTQDIAHNAEKVNKISKDHEKLVEDVGKVREDMNKVKIDLNTLTIQQGTVIRSLERIEERLDD